MRRGWAGAGVAVGLVWAGVKDGRVSPGLAVSALGEVARLGPVLVAEAVPTVTEALPRPRDPVGAGADAQAAAVAGGDLWGDGGVRRPAGPVGAGGAVVAAVGSSRGT